MRTTLAWAWVVGVLASTDLPMQGGLPSWGTAVEFEGGSERVEAGGVVGFPTSAVTVSMWLKVEEDASEAALFSYAAEGPCVSALSILRPGSLAIEVGCQTLITGVNLADARWHYLAVEWRSEGGVVDVFVDGELSFHGEGLQTGAVLPGGGTLVLGQQQGCVGGCFGAVPALIGLIDEVRIWDHARTIDQIGDDLQRTTVGPESGLVLGWAFDEGRFGAGAGARVRDVSGSGNDGWLVNRPRRPCGQGWPRLMLSGDDPLSVECHDVYEEPGAAVVEAPVALAAGYAHNLGLKGDGRLVAWGSGDAGQLRVETVANGFSAVAAGIRHSLALQRDGRVKGWGDDVWGQASVPERATNMVAVAAGMVHSLALSKDGTVLVWGHPDATAVVPDEATNVVAIAAGSMFNLALRADGRVVAWGRDEFGLLQIPESATNVISIASSYRHALALRADGTVVGWGSNGEEQVTVPEAATNVVSISAGYGHSLALRADGTVLAWGDDREGQCEVPELNDRAVAVAAGGNHSLALLADGSVASWGRAEEGQAEVPTELSQVDAAVHVSGTVDVNTPGDYLRVYVATLGDGARLESQRAVTVSDTVPPVVEFPGEDPLRLQVGDPFDPLDATVTDACAGDLTDWLTVTGEVDTAVVGAYELTYAAIDPSGNSNSVQRAVWVVGAPVVNDIKAVLTGTAGVRSARLEAEVVPNGLEGSVWFEVGMSVDTMEGTEPIELVEGYDPEGVAVDLADLEPGSSVYYRLVASNAVGTVTSTDRVLGVPEAYVPGDADGDGVVSQAELDAVLAHYWPYSPWLAMTNVATWGEGTFQFALTNSTAWEFSVEVSTNAVDWESLGPAVPVYQFRDPEGPDQPRRFYRLRWP